MSQGQMHGVGTVLGGRYLLESVRGVGGMGTVYQATHLTLDSPVAVKVLHAQFSRDEAYRKRFEREARVLSRLRHPSAVHVHDFGLHEGLLYIVMELIEGVSLREALVRRAPERLSYAELFHVASSLMDVLVTAHALPLVHRDLKPENILIESLPSGQERVIVVDFGMAFVVGSGELGRMTETGVVVGTPLYVSPEQAEGLAVGPPADIYSVGCILYELCAGRPPFMGKSSVHILNSHLFLEPPPLDEQAAAQHVPAPIRALIHAMLHKMPESRPSAGEALGALQRCPPTDAARPLAPSSRPLTARVASAQREQATELLAPSDLHSAPTEVMQSRAPSQRVAFLDVPIGVELIRAFSAHGMTCHIFNADERFDAVIALEPSPATLRILSATTRGIFALLEQRDAPRAQALRGAGALGVYALAMASHELAAAVAQELDDHVLASR